MKTFSLPNKGEYPSYYETYLDKVPDLPFADLIQNQVVEIKTLFESKPKGWDSIAYADGKWTPKEVLGHLIDTERIMTFRALCFIRGEKQSLPGFDENAYVDAACFSKVPLKDLLDDFEAQRKALLTLVNTLSEDFLDLQGKANEKSISPRALLWIIPGHFIHHVHVLNTRY
jgi:hypothetical protein